MDQGFPVERFHAIQEAWEVLCLEDTRRAHRRELDNRNAGETSSGTTRGSAPLRDVDLDRLNLELELPAAMAVRGGQFTTRIPIDISCPACSEDLIARASCDMCDRRGRLLLRVRSSLRLPVGIHHGDEIRVDCYFELFGHRVATARIYLV